VTNTIAEALWLVTRVNHSRLVRAHKLLGPEAAEEWVRESEAELREFDQAAYKRQKESAR
jgi:hypothetical protein